MTMAMMTMLTTTDGSADEDALKSDPLCTS